MNSDITLLPLSDIVRRDSPITYGVVKPGDEDPYGVAFIRSGDINGGTIDPGSLRTITSEVSRQYRRTLLEGGEILISLVGTPGQAAIVPQSLRGANIARQVALVRVDPSYSTRYIYYCLSSKQGKEALLAHSRGSVQQVINLGDLQTVEIPVPPLPEQKAIAHILGTLDDKIELNRKTNETLEAMAKALFESWFVDFDPVRAKAEGRPTGLPEKISDLLPDSFEDSELGEIPSGWRTGSLDEIAMNPRETAKPEEMNSTDRYIGLEHMPRGSICLGESGEAEELESNKNRFREGDILYSKLRPYFKKTGYAQFDGVCSTDIVVTRKKGSSGAGFICCLLASDPFIVFTVAASTGTRMPRTSWGDMCEFPVVIPAQRLLERFDLQFFPLIERIKTSCEYSVHLSLIRDALLPKLISGEIRIPDAERILEEVGV